MLRFLCIFVMCIAVVSEAAVSYASDVTKLAPEPIVIHVHNGVGSEKIVFFKASGTSVTKLITTQASGRVTTIPDSDIQATTETEADPSLFSVHLQVRTQKFIEYGVPYKGVLLIFTQAGKQPEQVGFTIQDDTALSIESLQASLDVSVGVWQPGRYQILIRNNGKASIDDISISSSNLTDSTTGNRILLGNPNPEWGKGFIEPDGERVISFDLPQPRRAGAFVGQLYVTANQQKTIAIPFTLRSRGPCARTALPFILFCGVLIGGFWISNVLDTWISGGGLVCAQTYLSLTTSQAALVQRFADLQDWKSHLPAHVPPIGLPRTEIWLQQGIQELADELRSVDQASQDQLTADAQRYVLIVGTISILWSAVKSATNTWSNDPAQLQPIMTALDNVPLPASAQDFVRYRNALLAAMPVALAIGPAGAVGLHVMAIAARWSPENVRRKIAGMALLYRSVVWVVVILTAYQSYYAHNLSFGTLADYLVLFIWAVGLTQTGSQILSRIHK